MGIFTRNRVSAAYETYTKGAIAPLAVASPWAPTDDLTQLVADELFKADAGEHVPMTRDAALRIPGVKRAHGIHVRQFAANPFRLMDNDTPVADQPKWLSSSHSGLSPYHRMYGLGSDFFFRGWGCLSFDRDPHDLDADCMHVPYGAWGIDPEKGVWVDGSVVPKAYRAFPVAIPLGYGDNGLLVDGIDTLREARKIEAAYMDRLDNPIPLTVLGIPSDVWMGWTKEERREYRDQWAAGRKAGGVATKPAEWPVDMPGQVQTDLYESGRNAVRLDIANHTGTPASLLEGVSQGGSGGSNIKYTGVQNGVGRNELWDFGSAKAFTLAFEARMSLDDICDPGLSIRADLTNMFALPEPNTNPTSED